MYGLLGKTLKHSLSKSIHESLRNVPYTLYETDDLASFFSHTKFNGINVTIPYKEAVLDYVELKDTIVKATGVANTIINQPPFKKAYNTDVTALIPILKTQIDLSIPHTIAILGNGGSAKSVRYALNALNLTNITTYARNPKTGEKTLDTIDKSTTILINTTPVSMYPNNADTPLIDISLLPNLVFVYDLIYNPLLTPLLLTAKQRNIKTLNGLSLLITQAIHANQLFFNTTYPVKTYETLYKKTLKKFLNIVLIGLPFSGKTHYAKLLGNRYNKAIIDIDKSIEKQTSTSINQLFKTEGEPYFRALESTTTIKYARANNQIISTGGGIINNLEAVKTLKQNSLIIYLDLDESLMRQINYHSRPHVKNEADLRALKDKRHALYKQYADVIIKKDTLDDTKILKEIEVHIDDYINNQWTQSKPTW